MEYKQQLCKTHGGYFSIPVKRGRPPTHCSDGNVCDRARKSNRVVTKDNTATAAEKRRATSPGATARAVVKRNAHPETPPRKPVRKARANVREEAPQKATRNRPEASNAVVSHNPSVPLAYEAKRLLEPQGWKCQGRAWMEAPDPASGYETGDMIAFASLIGTRGEEKITFLWRNRKLVSQEYSMWNSDKPSENGMPRRRLDFDPEEMSDAALIKRLSGRKVFWWNTLGKSAESATIPHGAGKRVKVEHLLDGNGIEEARVVTFVDASGNGSSGFRSFHVSALLKVNP